MAIDGTEVASTQAACPDGGCELALEKGINMAAFAGGAHQAGVTAEDGRGNLVVETWDINVDPDGQIANSELVDTLEAVEGTSASNLLGQATVEEIEGTTDGLELQEEGSDILSEGSAVPTLISTDSSEGVTMSILEDGMTDLPCDEPAEGPEGSPVPLCGAVEGQEAGSWGEQHISVTPVATGPAAASTELAGQGAVSANTADHVDTVQRPLYDGVLTVKTIRDPAGPEDYSWRINLEEGQTVKLIDADHAQVYYSSGHAAFAINAEKAHDATGAAVATQLSVAGDVLTLTVRHRSVATVVYPVIAGVGWEGGFVTSLIEGPKDEKELREERELLEREAREAREREDLGLAEELEEEIIQEPGAKSYSLRTVVQGPPVISKQGFVPLAAQGSNLPPVRERAYRFNECHFDPIELPGEGPPEVPGVRRRVPAGTSQQCHGDSDAPSGLQRISWAFAVAGTFKYRWSHSVWLPAPPTCIPPWGPARPKQIECLSSPINVASHDKVWVWDRAKFKPGDFMGGNASPGQNHCAEIEGVMSTTPPASANGERVLFETMHFRREPVWELCSWKHLYGV